MTEAMPFLQKAILLSYAPDHSRKDFLCSERYFVVVLMRVCLKGSLFLIHVSPHHRFSLHHVGADEGIGPYMVRRKPESRGLTNRKVSFIIQGNTVQFGKQI